MILFHTKRLEEKFYFDVEAIRVLDPLDADPWLVKLPELNQNKDSARLIYFLQQLSNRVNAVKINTPEAAFAAMRDIGMVLGSLKRHGIEPVNAVPDIEQQLIQLGRATDMIPRDTVHHYTSWNPPGERRRMYTGDEQEKWLQNAVVSVFPSLSASLSISDELSKMDPRDVRFGPTVKMLTESARPMIEAIESVTERVSPVFFAQGLRPYFEEIVVAGEYYLGPVAAQSPLWLIDLCVWASDRNHDDYQQFVSESIHYSLPSWREFYDRHLKRPSLVSKVVKLLETEDKGASKEGLIRSAKSLAELLNMLKVFRGRHIGMAHRAYAEEVRLYDHGSGGAPVALLRQILDLTRENEQLMLTIPGFHRRNNSETTQPVAVAHTVK